MTRDQMKTVAERHLAAEGARDVAGSVATYREDCFYENAALRVRFAGKEAVALQYGATFAALPDGEAIFEGEAYGDDVLVHWGTFRGTVTGSFLGLPPTGRQVAFPFVGILFFKDGLMEGERIFFDLATLAEQAGIPLEQAEAAARALRSRVT